MFRFQCSHGLQVNIQSVQVEIEVAPGEVLLGGVGQEVDLVDLGDEPRVAVHALELGAVWTGLRRLLVGPVQESGPAWR